MGVVIAQMSRIQRTVHPIREHEIKYYVLGVPQAAICQVIAIIVMAVAVFRFFKHERAIKRGKAHVGGWDLLFTGALIMLVSWWCAMLWLRLIWPARAYVHRSHLLHPHS